LVAGPRSNAVFLAALARADDFRAERFDTGFIARHLEALLGGAGRLDRAAAAAGAARLIAREHERIVAGGEAGVASPWDTRDGFQLSGRREIALPLDADGESVTATVAYPAGDVEVTVDGVAAAADARVIDDDGAVYVLRHGRQTTVRLKALDAGDAAHPGQGGRVSAPMHGKVLEVLVSAGDAVRKGQRLAVIEAMKMEHALSAPRDGIVADLRVSAGSQVAEGALLMTIEPA
jgi:3-methylcrotonyl-CoA carboxylase alpha subunit